MRRSQAWFTGFGECCFLGRLSARCHFVQVRRARSYFTCALRSPASEAMLFCCSFSCAEPAPSETAGGNFTGRAQAFPLRPSASPLGLQICRHPTRLTIRSSRPRVVASAACFTLRLHASAAPPRVGLTQALGGRKAFCSYADRMHESPASVSASFRKDSRHVTSSSKSAGRAHKSHALRSPASEASLSFVQFPALHAVTSDRSS